MLIHGLYDFNLHIPGNAALFFALSWIATGGKKSGEGFYKWNEPEQARRAYTS